MRNVEVTAKAVGIGPRLLALKNAIHIGRAPTILGGHIGPRESGRPQQPHNGKYDLGRRLPRFPLAGGSRASGLHEPTNSSKSLFSRLTEAFQSF